ncbi:MAG TPA: hydroxymethylbilane synthase [Candidatus Krumholzibacteria bacterium]
MSTGAATLRFGTRGSALARWQTDHVIDLIRAVRPGVHIECDVFSTRGDQVLDTPLPLIGGKGLFTEELEAALLSGRIDCAVHSLKDLPTESRAGLTVAATPVRAHVQDVLVSRKGYTIATLPQGASVGTSSLRRSAQLLKVRPDLRILDLRGNVDTRVRKALDENGAYDAIVLARAGLERLGHGGVISEVIAIGDMLPAPGQGAIAVQSRDEAAQIEMLSPIHHLHTAMAVTAERAFLAGLGGGCSVPVSAYGDWTAGRLGLRGRVSSPDGRHHIDVNTEGDVNSIDAARSLGLAMAKEALGLGAGELLKVKT